MTTLFKYNYILLCNNILVGTIHADLEAAKEKASDVRGEVTYTTQEYNLPTWKLVQTKTEVVDMPVSHMVANAVAVVTGQA